MVISCAAFGCTNRQLKGSFIQFHRFPLKRTDVLQKWIKEVRRKNFIPTKYSFLCSEHFIESDYQIRPGATTKLLYDNAVPSVFKAFPVHLQKSLSVKRRLLQRNNTDFNTTILPSSKQTETTSENIETGEETSSLSVQKINNKDKSIQCVIKSPTEEQLRCKIQILQKRLKRRDLKIKNFKSLLASIKKNVPASDKIISILEDNFDYGNNMSITQHSNIMSDNDNIVPSCSTSNPIPSCSNTNLISSNSKVIQNANCNTVNLNESCNNPGPSNEDEELTLPRASVNKMIKDALPNIRVANDVREMIMNCCSEFIHLVSSEANQVCMAQHKKTINAEHLLTALDQLGFGDYRAQAEEVVKDCKSKRRRQSTRLENLGIPEEELLRQQQELFAKAREEQMAQEQQQWQELQAAAQQAAIKSKTEESSDEDDYS